jgi:putative ABC transport system permease protein
VNTAAAVPRLRLGQLLRLAWRDLWHERWLALCAACVLGATLAPLWTLWGLERGVIGTLIERQDRDPLMRELVPASTGSGRFDAAWLEKVRRWPELAFVIPTVRSAAALVELFSETANAPVMAELRSTAAGDPLLAGMPPPTGTRVWLSTEAAQRLQARPGQALQIPLRRERDGQAERAALAVQVAGVLPLAASDGVSALASPALLESIEAWRDGYRVDGFGEAGSGPAPLRTVHPLFRMYAASIRDVETLAARLEAEGISTHTRAREIASTLGLQRNLRTVLALVAGITLAGAVVALAALQIATVRRKRREYALLKLTGHGRGWLIALPCVHAVVVALAGALLALGVYAVAAAAINVYFAGHLVAGEAAVRLGAVEVAAGVCAAVLISMLPALWGGWRASNVEAADELRDS